MVDYPTLFNYGILGLWTTTLLYDKYKTLNKMTDILTEIKNLLSYFKK